MNISITQLSWLIPLFVTLFCFWDAFEACRYHPNWWSRNLLLATGVSGLAWLIWWKW